MAVSCRLLGRRSTWSLNILSSSARSQRVHTHTALRSQDVTEKSPEPKAVESLVPQNVDLFRERFVPLSRRTTISYLMQDANLLNAGEKKDFERFALSLDAVVATQYAATSQELKSLFEPINPDKDTIVHRQMTRRERLDNEFWLLQRLGQVLEKANFHELSESEVKIKLHDRDSFGVKVDVDTSKYDVLKFWALGKESVVPQLTFKERLQRLIARQPTNKSVSYYKRVVAAVRLKVDDKLLLKAFREVAANDLEKLLPQGTIQMGAFDKWTVYSSLGLLSLGVLSKLVTVLASVTVTWPLWLTVAGALLGLRGWLTYRRKQNTYLASLNKILYYKNIANNRGLVNLIVDRAEDESFKEMLLTYTFVNALNRVPELISCQPSTGDTPLSSAVTMISLETAVEDWLLEKTGKKIEFDANESIAILERIGVLSQKSSAHGGQTFSVLPLHSALHLLPQTPMSILTRVEESDILEGYDRTVYEEDESQFRKRDKLFRRFGWFK